MRRQTCSNSGFSENRVSRHPKFDRLRCLIIICSSFFTLELSLWVPSGNLTLLLNIRTVNPEINGSCSSIFPSNSVTNHHVWVCQSHSPLAKQLPILSGWLHHLCRRCCRSCTARGLAVNEWDWINPIFPPNIKIQRVDVRMHTSCTVGERQNCLELT